MKSFDSSPQLHLFRKQTNKKQTNKTTTKTTQNKTPIHRKTVRLFPKPLFELLLECCQFETYEQNSMKSQAKFIHFRSPKTFENVVCETASILSRPQCVTCIIRHDIITMYSTIELQSLRTHTISNKPKDSIYRAGGLGMYPDKKS